VEQDVIHAGAAGLAVDLTHEDLDLVGFHLLGEDRGERLRVGVGEVARLHVLAAVLVAAEIGQTDPRDPELLELAVLPHPRERDRVVDLADLVQGGAGVLRDEQESVDVLHADHRSAACDALVRVVRAILHQLLGSDVGHEAHDARSCSTVVTAAATSASATSADPPAVTVSTTGKIPRAASGPPVAASSSAASINASTATRSASSKESPSRHRFFK